MSQDRLAELSGLSNGYISLIETGGRGKKPSRDTVISLAQALNAPLVDFLRASGRLRPEDETVVDRGRPSFEAFVATDSALRTDQKKVLIDLYKSWVRSTT